MANEFLAEVVIPHVDGFTKDEVVNTFVFFGDAEPPSTTNLSDAATAIEAFYNTIPSGLNSIAGTLNDSRSRASNAVVIKFYDIHAHLNGSPHGSPVGTATFTLGAQASGGGALPAEVAAVLTYRSPYFSDVEFSPGARPRSRHRGRLYIGPLTASALTLDSTTKRAYVTAGFRTTMKDAASALATLGGTAIWGQWSRKAALVRIVTDGWVDDAFDIQRRRGEDPITRTVWP